MMPNRIFMTLAFAAAALVAGGCANEDPNEHHFDNRLYLDGESTVTTLLLKKDTPSYTLQLTAAMALPQSHDVEVELAADPSLVERYNLAYSSDAVMLPAENYSLASPTTVIGAGSVASVPVELSFTGLDLLPSQQLYVLPVTIVRASVPVLESRRTFYYLFREGALINVVGELEKNYLDVNWTNADVVNNLTALTVEALVFARDFDREISTLMGIEGKFLLRFGDATFNPGQLQVVNGNSKFPDKDDSKAIPTNEWVHVAVTYESTGAIRIYVNGALQSEGKCGSGAVNWGSYVPASQETTSKRGFHIGYSYTSERYFAGNIAEVRIWNRVLSADEIAASNHFYWVDPASEGLVAYWKFDDGEGNTVRDHTGNGNDARAFAEMKWKQVELLQSEN